MTQISTFISYSRADGGDFARHLKKHLEDKNYSVFLDTYSLSVGAKWKPKIESVITSCDIFILIITGEAMNSKEVEEEFSFATSKRKLTMLFKLDLIDIHDLQLDLKDRNLLEFNTPESLVRIFDEKFQKIDELITHDLADPFAVELKLKSLKEEFDSIPQDYSIEAIQSYADDNFIPIMDFLKKSSVFYSEEVKAIEQVLARILRLSQNIEENKENQIQEIFIRKDADILKSSLSDFLDYFLAFFITNPPEKRLQSAKHETEDRVLVKQIATETKDFLTISMDRSLTENDKHELFKQDIENEKIDIRFLYLEPDSIDLWFKIINRSDYKFNRIGRDLFEKNSTELVNIIFENSLPGNGHIDLINLGVGAAIKDYYILKAFLEKMPKDSVERMNYIPVDYSIGILQKSMDFMDELMDIYPNKLHIEGILGDFFQLVRYSDRIQSISQSPKAFALLGNIFGNVDESRILSTVTRTMDSNDLLLLEIDLINDRTDDQLKEGYGSDTDTKNFLLNPILNYFKAESKKTRTAIGDFQLRLKIQGMGRIPGSKSVVTSAHYGENYRERIELVHSHKYDLEPLLNYLYDGWNLGHLKTYKEQNACLLLLKKRPSSIDVPTTTLVHQRIAGTDMTL